MKDHGQWVINHGRELFLKQCFDQMGITKRDGRPLDLERDNFLSNEEVRKWFFVNCWHENDTENVAMWKLYGKGEGAVAIQTTYQKLTNILPHSVLMKRIEGSQTNCDSFPILMAKMHYTNYSKVDNYIGGSGLPGENFFLPFVHKRKEFEHEREVRAIVCAPFSVDIGKEIGIDIDIIEFSYNIPKKPTLYSRGHKTTPSRPWHQ